MSTQPDSISLFDLGRVVTGSSDGIGKAYARQLAQRGLNLILVSRDIQKLQQTAIELNEQYSVEVDFIALTFDGDPHKYTRLKAELEKRDIGILVNNVGVTYDYPQYFLDVPLEMVERGKGAIVNLSAGACSRPTPQMAVYSATKAYVDLISRALHYEYKDQGITVQSLMPFYVGTRMQGFTKSLSQPSKLLRLIPTAECYAKHAALTLGYSSRTTGYWLHTVQGWILWMFPDWLWLWGASRLSNALRRQAQERLKSKAQRRRPSHSFENL